MELFTLSFPDWKVRAVLSHIAHSAQICMRTTETPDSGQIDRYIFSDSKIRNKVQILPQGQPDINCLSSQGPRLSPVKSYNAIVNKVPHGFYFSICCSFLLLSSLSRLSNVE